MCVSFRLFASISKTLFPILPTDGLKRIAPYSVGTLTTLTREEEEADVSVRGWGYCRVQGGDPMYDCYHHYGTVRYYTARYGTIRYGIIRYGTIRYGTVRYGTHPARAGADDHVEDLVRLSPAQRLPSEQTEKKTSCTPRSTRGGQKRYLGVR